MTMNRTKRRDCK